jgi:ketosteroid isomerase-like protein
MDVSVPHAVSDYFEADARRDIDGIVALFTGDAVVLDEGQTWRGTSEIRDWQLGPASKYQYTTQVLGAQATGENTILVTGRLTGNFPGGVADLKWLFTLDADLIQRLKIAP